MRSFSSPEAPPFLGWSRCGFSAAEPTWICRLGAHADSKTPSRSIIGSTFPATCSQLCLPRDPPVLKPKPAQAPGMWHQARSYGVRARVSILYFFSFLCFSSLIWNGIYSWMTRLWGFFFSSILDLQQLDSLTHRCTYVLFCVLVRYRILQSVE